MLWGPSFLHSYFPEKGFSLSFPLFSPPLLAGATVRRQTAAPVPRTKVLEQDYFSPFNLSTRNTKECCGVEGGRGSLGTVPLLDACSVFCVFKFV